MRNANIVIMVFLLGALVAACGPEAPPVPIAKGDPADLANTTWQAGDFKATFIEGGTMRLHVEGLQDEHPEGIEGQWKVEDGIFEAQALDQIRTGTWDGTNLVVDGAMAQMIEDAAIDQPADEEPPGDAS